MSNNSEPTAVDAAAERRLAAVKSSRVSRAEARLTASRDRLGRAQVSEETAAAALSQHEWSGNTQRVLESRNEVEVSTSLVAHAERELTKAKARATPEEKQAAIELVTTERARASFNADIDPDLATIRATAIPLIAAVKSVIARCGQQSSHSVILRDAHDALGLPYNEAALLRVPEPAAFVAAALLDACKTASFSPWDWRDIVSPERAVPLRLATPGLQAIISPNERADVDEVNGRFRASLEAEIDRGAIVKEAERRHFERVNATPSLRSSALGATPESDRVSLAVDE